MSEEALPEGHDVYGGINWPVAELISKCIDAEVGRPLCRSVVEWWNLNAACLDGFFPSSCMGHLMFSLQVDFNVKLRDWNNRPDPLHWGFHPGPLASVL